MTNGIDGPHPCGMNNGLIFQFLLSVEHQGEDLLRGSTYNCFLRPKTFSQNTMVRKVMLYILSYSSYLWWWGEN